MKGSYGLRHAVPHAAVFGNHSVPSNTNGTQMAQMNMMNIDNYMQSINQQDHNSCIGFHILTTLKGFLHCLI